jgi:hypothetical protein
MANCFERIVLLKTGPRVNRTTSLFFFIGQLGKGRLYISHEFELSFFLIFF